MATTRRVFLKLIVGCCAAAVGLPSGKEPKVTPRLVELDVDLGSPPMEPGLVIEMPKGWRQRIESAELDFTEVARKAGERVVVDMERLVLNGDCIDRHNRFIKEYLKDCGARRAAESVGYAIVKS